jgi:hypothetical protein
VLTDIQRRGLDNLRTMVLDARNRAYNAMREAEVATRELGLTAPIDGGLLDGAQSDLGSVYDILGSMLARDSDAARATN